MSPHVRSFRRALRAAATLALVACSDSPGAPTTHAPSSITLHAPAGDVYERDVIELRAVVRDRRGAIIPDAAVNWSVSDADRAAVAPDGSTTFLTPGTVTVTANVGLLTTSQSFDVKRVSVLHVSITPPRQLLAAGDQFPIGVRVQGEGGREVYGCIVRLETDDPDVIAIDNAGPLRALEAGTATIRATVVAEGVSGTARIRVVDDEFVHSLSRVGEAKLPLLIDADSVSWNGVREYHEVYLEGGRLIVTTDESPRYTIDVRYAEYHVEGPPGARTYSLRHAWRDRDFGVTSIQANGLLVLTSEYVSPLQHTASSVTEGMRVHYRLAGTDEFMDLLYGRT